MIQTRPPTSEKDENSFIYNQECIDLDKLISILYKETMRLSGKLQKINEKSKEYNRSIANLARLLSVLVDLLKIHKSASMKEQQHIFDLLNSLEEEQGDELPKDLQKTVEETIKEFGKSRRKL